MKTNRILFAVALSLFALSAFSYHESVQRAERFERGQKFLSNLNPDSIAEILVVKEGETTHLRRDGDNFVVVSADGYPAKNESVNRFVRDVLEISLEKKVGSGESLEQELELSDDSEDATRLTFKDSGQQEMVNFLIGKSMEGGSGNYVRRIDDEAGTIFLTSSQVYLNSGADSFLKKEILDVEQSEIAAIGGAGFRIEDLDGSLALADLPAGKKESSKVGQLKSLLSGLRFTKHYLADASEVRGLSFDSAVQVELKDQSGYEVAVASRDEKHYLRIVGFHTAGQLSIAMDADEEEAREVSEQLKRQTEINDFNTFHGSWIYEVSETTAGRVKVAAGDLVEDA